MDTPRGPAVPLIGLLLLGMTFATGILAGHLCLDIITALQASAADARADAESEPGAQEALPAWRERLLEPWPQGEPSGAGLPSMGSEGQNGSVPPKR